MCSLSLNVAWLARARDGVALDVPHMPFIEDEDHTGESEDDDHAGESEEEDHHGETEEEEDHHHEDPHFWLSTLEATEMVEHIEHKLSDLDPEGAELYRSNADAAILEIQSLTKAILSLLEDVRTVPFAVTHDGFQYFVRQFELTQVGSLSDIQDSAASAKTVSNLAEMAKSGEIVCVFGEVAESNKLAQVLVDEGAKLGKSLDPAGISLNRGPTLYSELILGMAQSFKDCLSD